MRRFAPLALLLAASSIAAVSNAEVKAGIAPSPASLTHVDTTAFDGLKIATYQQTIEGIPVLHRGARVSTDGAGREHRAERLEALRPATLVPTLSQSGAIKVAARLGVPADSNGARLIILPTGGTPVLTWAIVGDLGAIPSRPVVFLDAHTGEVALAYDAVHTLKKAKVFANNPTKDKNTTEVTLLNDATLPGLQNTFVKALNCIDKKTTKAVNFGVPLTVHVCELEPTIVPDASGDYLAILPEFGAREDKYAELSMFYHTDRVYEHVKALGFPDAKVTKINAVANLRVPQGMNSFDTKKMADPELPLAPFDNAFFAEKDPLLSTAFGLDGDAMWFGHGTLADFGYDGDVVYHEFGHFLVSRTIKLGGGTFADEFGLTYSPGALNEGIADVLSFFLTDDPELGEYTSTGIGLPKGKGMRSATNTFKFPDAITGEVHQDGEPFVAAMWKVYATLDAAKKQTFQKDFLKTLLTAPQGNLGYADFAELVVKNSTTSADALRASFDERGLKKGEPRVRQWADAPISSVQPMLGIHAPGKSDMPAGKSSEFAPGLFQIGYDAPAGGVTKIKVTYAIKTRGGTFGSGSGGGLFGSSGTPYAPALLAKVGADPIKFTYGPVKHDATTAVDCVISGDKKSATCDVELDVGGKWGETSKVHLMLVNKGEQGGDFDAVALSAEGPPEPPPTEPSASPTDPGTSKGGCACNTPGGTSNAPTFALLGLGLAIAARRRRR